MNKIHKQRSRSRGFSIMELVVTIIILAIGSSALIAPIMMFINIIVWDRHRNDLVDSSRLAMQRVNSELKQIRDENSILDADVSHFRFLNKRDEERAIKVVQDVGPQGQTIWVLMLRMQKGTGPIVDIPLTDFMDNTDGEPLAIIYYDQFGTALQTPIPAERRHLIRTIRFDMDFKNRVLPTLFHVKTEIQARNISDHDNFT